MSMMMTVKSYFVFIKRFQIFRKNWPLLIMLYWWQTLQWQWNKNYVISTSIHLITSKWKLVSIWCLEFCIFLFANHLLTPYQPLTDILPASYWHLTNQLLTPYQPLKTNHLLTPYQPLTDISPDTYWHFTNHLLTPYQPLTDPFPTTYWHLTNHLLIPFQPVTDTFLALLQQPITHGFIPAIF